MAQPKQPHSLIWPLDKLQIHVANGGRSKEVEVGKEEQLIRVSGDPAAGVHMTITLFQQRVDDAVIPPPATAIIKWGNDGTRTQAEVDIKHGTMITVPAGFVEVIGRNDGTVKTRLGAFIAYLPYFKPGAASKTQAIPGFAAGGFAETLIPDFSIGVVTMLNPGSAAIVCTFLDRTGAIVGVVNTIAGFNTADGLPIPNTAATLRVGSTSAVVGGSVIFELAL